MIKAVLFDLGGTLHICTGSEKRMVWFARRVLDRLADYDIHLDLTAEELARQLSVNAEIYKQESESTLCELPTDVIWNDYFLKEQKIGREKLAYMSEELSFLYDYERPCNLRRPHLTETLDTLIGMDLKVGLISNIISKSIVPHFLSEYGILDRMSCVITSSETGIRKPSPDIFRIAEAQLGLTPDELAYVGDTLSRDVRGVRNAGWKLMIQISSPASARRDVGITDVSPDWHIQDLNEIPKIIETENAKEA